MSLRGTFAILWSARWEVLATLVCCALLGEAWTRAPFVTPRVEYEVDRDLDGRLRPEQRGFMWMGNMSLRSPPITLNSDGHRGEETDWGAPVVLTLGGSDSFGSGVTDEETWAAVLERKIREVSGLEAAEVVNAAHPGHGPAHHVVTLRRVLDTHAPQAIIVRVALGMWNMQTPREEDKDGLVERTRARQALRTYTRFLPLVVTKAELQIPGLRTLWVPAFLRPRRAPDRLSRSELGQRLWERNRPHWEEMVGMARSRQIPLVFCVANLEGRDNMLQVANGLEGLCAQGGCDVLHLGPDILDLNPRLPPAIRAEEFRQRYTLRLDWHGNAKQHQAIAAATWEHLNATGLLARLLEEGGRPLPDRQTAARSSQAVESGSAGRGQSASGSAN